MNKENHRHLELIKQINLPRDERIGRRLRELRGEMSQEKLAEKTGISKQSISHWETNTYRMSIDALLIICKALDITPYDFFKKF